MRFWPKKHYKLWDRTLQCSMPHSQSEMERKSSTKSTHFSCNCCRYWCIWKWLERPFLWGSRRCSSVWDLGGGSTRILLVLMLREDTSPWKTNAHLRLLRSLNQETLLPNLRLVCLDACRNCLSLCHLRFFLALISEIGTILTLKWSCGLGNTIFGTDLQGPCICPLESLPAKL